MNACAPLPRERKDLSVIILSDHGSVTGGQAKVAIDSAVQLKAQGVDVSFVAGAGKLDQRLLDSGISCHVAGEFDILSDTNRLRAASNGLWNPAAARLVRKVIAAHDPRSTVVHVHGWAKALSPSIGPAVTRSQTAHVYTLHEYFLACPNGGFFNYRTGEVCTIKPMGIKCLRSRCDARSDLHKAWRVARQAMLLSASRMPRDLREVIYLAPEQRRIMSPYIAPEARWHYLPNAVDRKPSVRVASEANDLFLFVGRLSAEKGGEVVARAAAIADVPIAFCGDGERRDAIAGANPNASMRGWIAADEIEQWMRRARCIVFPSLWYECDPLVVADALRLGIPVLVSDSSVATSAVEHGVSGLHVRSGDPQAWADAMQSLLSDTFVEMLSKGAFQAGQQLADYSEYTDRLIDVYRSAIARKNGEQPARMAAGA